MPSSDSSLRTQKLQLPYQTRSFTVRERVKKQVCARRQSAINLNFSRRSKRPDCCYSRKVNKREYKVNFNNKTAKTKAESGFCVKSNTIPGQDLTMLIQVVTVDFKETDLSLFP